MTEMTEGLRVRRREPVPWPRAILLALLGISKVEIGVIVVLVGVAAWLIIPPVINQASSVYSQPRQTIGFVLELSSELEHRPLAIDVDSEVLIDGGTYGNIDGGIEMLTIKAYTTDEDMTPVDVRGATVLHAGDRSDPLPGNLVQWLCGPSVDSDDVNMLAVDPNNHFTEGADSFAVKALDSASTEWTSTLTMTPQRKASVQNVGVGCLRHIQNFPVNDAGNVWFTPTDYVFTLAFRGGGTSPTAVSGEQPYLYTQKTKVVTPTRWSKVSGFVNDDGSEIGGSYFADLLNGQGYALTTLPLTIPRPGSLPTLVWADTLVERGIEQRLTGGWSVAAAALALFIGGYVARLAGLRRDNLELA